MLAAETSRHMELYGMTAKERSRLLFKRNPDLLRAVPHNYLAFYLDMDPWVFRELFNSIKL